MWLKCFGRDVGWISYVYYNNDNVIGEEKEDSDPGPVEEWPWGQQMTITIKGNEGKVRWLELQKNGGLWERKDGVSMGENEGSWPHLQAEHTKLWRERWPLLRELQVCTIDKWDIPLNKGKESSAKGQSLRIWWWWEDEFLWSQRLFPKLEELWPLRVAGGWAPSGSGLFPPYRGQVGGQRSSQENKAVGFWSTLPSVVCQDRFFSIPFCFSMHF